MTRKLTEYERLQRKARQEAPTLELIQQITTSPDALILPEREFIFHPKRKWRFDLAWPALLIAAEIEGGIWNGGRHVRGEGYEGDCEKYDEAQLLGWMVLRFSTGQIKNGYALKTITTAQLAKLED